MTAALARLVIPLLSGRACPPRGYVDVVSEGSSAPWPDGVDGVRGRFRATAVRA
jgi:hypothetical protein